MALTETPVEIKAGLEGSSTSLDCEGCYLNPAEGASFRPCTVVEALRTTLSLPQFDIALKIISRPDGEFTRKDILSEPEAGDSVDAQRKRYLGVLNFMQTSPVLGNLIGESGIRGGRIYDFNAGGIPQVCSALENGATLESRRSKAQEADERLPVQAKRKILPSSAAAKTKSAVLDLLTKSPDDLEFVWDADSRQVVFGKINEVYGNLTNSKDIYSNDGNGRLYSKITNYVPAEQRVLLRRHKQEAMVDGVEILSELGDSGNEVWSDIAEYLSGGRQLPVLAKASLAELILIKNDLESPGLLPNSCPDTVYAKLWHVRSVIIEILNMWDQVHSVGPRNGYPLSKRSWVTTEWDEFANCKGVDPDLFFPERGASTREAKEVCRGCQVREDCRDYALTTGERFGIWGGMSERERRGIKRQRSQALRREKSEDAAGA